MDKTHKLELAAADVGNVHVVGRGGEFFVLLASEDLNSNEMDLGMTVLAGLGGRHIDDLAGLALDDDVAALAEGRALHGERQRRAGVGGLERDIVLNKPSQLLVMAFAPDDARRHDEIKSRSLAERVEAPVKHAACSEPQLQRTRPVFLARA